MRLVPRIAKETFMQSGHRGLMNMEEKGKRYSDGLLRLSGKIADQIGMGTRETNEDFALDY
jgi:hypothetical protein